MIALPNEPLAMLPKSIRHSRHVVATSAILVLSLPFGCRHPVVATGTPPPPAEQHCWWAVIRSALPPDSVAARFQRGFAAAGLTGAMTTHDADTARAHAGPTQLGGAGGAMYSARAVAYVRG